MARGKRNVSSERRDGQHAERSAGRAAAPGADHEGPASPETEIASPYATSLLGDSRLSGRGNRPVQIAAMRSMQQTYGNRAMQRFLQRTRSALTGAPAVSPQGPPLIQGLPFTPILSLPVAVQRQSEGQDEEQGGTGGGVVAMIGPASAPSEQEELPVQTARARNAPLPVQRQDPPTKTKPRSAPKIPSGSYVVGLRDDEHGQGYWYTFNSEDVKNWGKWGDVAFGYYIKDVFKGGTDAIAAEYIAELGITTLGDAKESATKEPTTGIGIRGDLHKAVVRWMAKKHPEVRARGTSPGYHDLDEQHGGGGTPADGNGAQNGQPANVGGDVASADLQKIRELFEVLGKNFRDHVVFSEDGLTIEDFLQFLADNPDALKRLPPVSSSGAAVKNKDELKGLLDKVKQHLTSKGSKTGSPKGHPRGVEGGAEDGIIKFEPVGKLILMPDEDKYVKGSNLRMRVEFDRSDPYRAAMNVYPSRANFDWTITLDGTKYDNGPTFELMGGHNEYDVDLNKTGTYSIGVNVKSARFKDNKELDLDSKPVVVVEEKEREKEVFDKTLVGKDDENMPFERDEKGNLKLKGGQKPLTVDEELILVELQVGALTELAAQGKISASDKENFIKYFEQQREALKALKDKATDKPYFVRGTFLSRETSSHMEVKTYMFQTKREKEGSRLKYGVILHDTTLSPENPTQHPGEGSEASTGPDDSKAWAKAESKAVDQLAAHWNSYNDYPEGKVHLGIKSNEDDTVYEKVIETHTTKKTAKKWLGYAAMGAGVVMLAASPFTGGTSAGVGVIVMKTAFVVGGATGLAAMVTEVNDRYEKEGRLKPDGRLMLDLLQVITLALGATGTFTSLLKGGKEAVKAGMFVSTMAGLDVAQGVLISDQVRQQILAVEAQYAVSIGMETDTGKKEMLIKERNSAVAQVLGAAAVNGGFILISLASGTHQLMTLRGRMSGKPYMVRQELKGIVESNDPAAIRAALEGHNAGTKVLTPDERAYLQEALAKTPTKTAEQGGETVKQPEEPGNVVKQPEEAGNTVKQPEEPANVVKQPEEAGNTAQQPEEPGNAGNIGNTVKQPEGVETGNNTTPDPATNQGGGNTTPDPATNQGGNTTSNPPTNQGGNTTTPDPLANTTNQGGGITTPAAPQAEGALGLAQREAAVDAQAAAGLARLEAIFGEGKLQKILGWVDENEIQAFLRTINDGMFDPKTVKSLGNKFFMGLGQSSDAMEFARTYGRDLLVHFYRTFGSVWSDPLADAIQKAMASLSAATPEARATLIGEMLAANNKKALNNILGILPPPKPAQPAKATKATMGIDRSHSSWKAFRADAEVDAQAHGETLTPDELDIRADLEMVRDRAKRGDLAKLSYADKVSILNRFDDLARQSKMGTGPINGKRGDLAEALFNPDYGKTRYAFKDKKAFNLKDVPKDKRNTYTKPDYRHEEGGVVEWVELKSDLIDDGPKPGGVYTSGKAAANLYVKHATTDAPDLPPGDQYSIHFIRDPGEPTRKAMRLILLAPESPIYRVKFGDGPWEPRPP
jgi:hypothetical protein